MKLLATSFLALAGVLATSSAWAQALPEADPSSVGMSAERLDRIGAVFQAEIDKGELPGTVIMVAREGKLVYSTALGEMNPSDDTPMSDDALFRIYSMTKPLASVATMILMEQGKLELTDPVSKFLPAFKDMTVSVPSTDMYGKVSYNNVPAERAITVQDLLRHTAGLAYGELTQNPGVKDGYAAAGAYSPDGLAFDARGIPAEDQVAALARTPLVHQPGTVWEYSLASDVLGRVVEAASGMRLSDFLEAEVFGPLDMDDTSFSVSDNATTRLAQPFEIDPTSGQPLPMIDVSETPGNDSGGAGAISSADDYLRFSQMLLNGGELDGARILSPTTIRLMTSDHLGDRIEAPVEPGELLMGVPGYTFGLGFMVREEDGIAGVPGSEGEFMWAGYGGTFFWVDPKEDLVAVLMSQRAGPSRAYYRKLVKQLVHQAITDEPSSAMQEARLQQ